VLPAELSATDIKSLEIAVSAVGMTPDGRLRTASCRQPPPAPPAHAPPNGGVRCARARALPGTPPELVSAMSALRARGRFAPLCFGALRGDRANPCETGPTWRRYITVTRLRRRGFHGAGGDARGPFPFITDKSC
jgi:hypothetical protein